MERASEGSGRGRSSLSSTWVPLGFLFVSAVTIMVVGIENVLQKPIAMVLLILMTVLPVLITRSFKAVGVSRQNVAGSIVVGSGVGIAYGAVRGLILALVPNSGLVFGADLARIAPRLETGIQIGPLLLTSYGMFLLTALVLGPGFVGIESYFRGFMFLTLKKYVPWGWALVATSIVQTISRRTPHSLIMGSIAGLLMQRYDNILAPLFFHGFQFFVALAIFLSLR